MSNIVARAYEPHDERAMNEVIQKSFKNPAANAYPLPPSRFIVIAELDGKVVGHTSIRPMLFHVGSAKVAGGILHMVGTDPAFQHKGVGHAMMDKVIEIMEGERIVASLLETPVPRFYGLKGWEVISDRVEISAPRIAIEAGMNGFAGDLELRDGSLGRIATYTASRERMGDECLFFAHTNDDYMALLIDKAIHGSLVDFFHEVWLGGQYKGYVLGNRDASAKEGDPLRINVRELALETYDPPLVAAILKELVSFDEEFQAVVAGFNVVPGLARAMKALGGSESRVGGNVDMVRINMVKEFIEATRSQPGDRITREAPCLDVLLDVDGEQVLLTRDGKAIPVGHGWDAGAGRAALAMSRNDFARVATGRVSPSELVKQGRARCDQIAALEQIDAMFSAKPVVINYNNSFYQAHGQEMGSVGSPS